MKRMVFFIPFLLAECSSDDAFIVSLLEVVQDPQTAPSDWSQIRELVNQSRSLIGASNRVKRRNLSSLLADGQVIMSLNDPLRQMIVIMMMIIMMTMTMTMTNRIVGDSM